MDIRLTSAEDIHKVMPVFRELRPQRTEDELRRLLLIAFEEGYNIAYVGNDKVAFSIVGFRILTFIFSGKTLRIDDLATLSKQRKNGYAGKLFQWAIQHAKNENCEHINLDSGFQRRDAHKFYLNQGLFIESLHFGRNVVEL